MNLNVTGITVFVKSRGADELHFDTDKPSPFPASVSDEPLTLKTHVRAGGGVEYVKKNFPHIRAETLDMSTGKRERFQDAEGHWSEHPEYPVADWQYEVANNDTRLGYRAWVENKQQ